MDHGFSGLDRVQTDRVQTDGVHIVSRQDPIHTRSRQPESRQIGSRVQTDMVPLKALNKFIGFDRL